MYLNCKEWEPLVDENMVENKGIESSKKSKLKYLSILYIKIYSSCALLERLIYPNTFGLSGTTEYLKRDIMSHWAQQM